MKTSNEIRDLIATIEVQRDGFTAPYAQIAQEIERMILCGAMPSGTILPTKRELRSILSVNQWCIDNTLLLLRERGLVRGGKGTRTTVLPLPTPRLTNRDFFTHAKTVIAAVLRDAGEDGARALLATAYEEVCRKPMGDRRPNDGGAGAPRRRMRHPRPPREGAARDHLTAIVHAIRMGARQGLQQGELRTLLRAAFECANADLVEEAS
jgi:DNA-binding transcriptional regulator YhcF (GntR family)